jgi:hypothetical protein
MAKRLLKSSAVSIALSMLLGVLSLQHAPHALAQYSEPTEPTASTGREVVAPYAPKARHRRARTLMAMAYSMGFSAGDLHSYIGDMSPRGFDFHLMMRMRGHLYGGLSVGYNRFYEERPRQTYQLEDADVTATLFRSFRNVSLAATARYYLLNADHALRPYGGLRLGAAFVSSWTAVADFDDTDSVVGFLLTPEAGATLRIAESLGAFVGYQYNFTTASFRSVDHASYHALQVGFQVSY